MGLVLDVHNNNDDSKGKDEGKGKGKVNPTPQTETRPLQTTRHDNPTLPYPTLPNSVLVQVLIRIPKPVHPLQHDLTPLGPLIAAPVVERHPQRGCHQVELCARHRPQPRSVCWRFLLHEHGRGVDPP